MQRSVLAACSKAPRMAKATPLLFVTLIAALVLASLFSTTTPAPVSAAIAQRGTATTADTSTTSLTINKPAGVVAGDVMLANIAKEGNDTTNPSSPGWTLVASADLGGMTQRHGAVLYRVVDGTEGASFTFALGTGTNRAVCAIVSISGVDTSGPTPFDVAPGAISVQGNQQAVVATSITTVSPNAAIVMFGMAANDNPTWSGWTTTSPGALTELYDAQTTGAGGQASVGAAWATKADAGPTGTGVATLSQAERNGGILIALKPPIIPTTLTVDSASGTYGGTCNLTATLSPAVAGKTIGFTLNGAPAGAADTNASGVATIAAADLTGIPVGTYATGVGASFAGDSGYGPSSGTNSLTVKVRDLTVTATGIDKIYDGTTDATVSLSTDALPGDDVTASYSSATFADKNVDTGIAVSVTGIAISGADAGNYNLLNTADDTTASITPKELTVTGIVGIDKVYDATTAATVDPSGAALNGLVGTDNVGFDISGATSNFGDKNVGTGKTITVNGLLLTGPDAGNYYLTAPTATADITPRDLTVTATGIDKVYDGSVDATVNLSTDALGGDNVTAIYSSATFADKNVGTGKDVSVTGISLTGPDAGNYNLLNTAASTKADITPRELTVTGLVGMDKAYDGNAIADVNPSGAVLNGVVGGDNVTVDDTFAAAYFDDRNVGIGKTITVTGLVLTGADAGNYYLVDPTTTADITPRPIEITADNQTKTYGNADPALTWTVTSGPLVGGDTTTGALARDAGENVGLYCVTQGTLAINDGNGGANYDLTFMNGQLDITQRAITITADNNGKAYGTPDPALTWTVTSGTLIGTDNVTGTLARNAGEDVGTYAITQGTLAIDDGNGGLNYDLTFVNGQFQIAARQLTINGITADNKVYDGTTFATVDFSGAVLNGVVGGDNVTVDYSGAIARFDNRNVDSGKTVTIIGLVLTGADAGNYYLAPPTTTANITKADLTITAQPNTKTYDGTTSAAALPIVTGLLPGDTVTGLAETYDNANVGTGKTLSVTAYTVNDGNSGNNYDVTLVNNTSGMIAAKALTITASNRSKTYGDTVTFAGTEFTATGLVAGDTITSVTLTSSGAGAAAAIGTYPILPSAAVGTGLSNYGITYVNGILTVNPRPLTITATDGSKTYGETLAFAGTEFTATGLVGSDTVSGVTLASTGAAASAAVGTYSIVPSAATGTSLGNYTVSYVNGTLTVTKTTASLNVVSSATTSNKGRSVTFTVTVTDPRATGTVTLMDGNTVIDTAALSNGAATLEISTLSVGSHSITAVYGGDANFSGATSSPVEVTVKASSKGIDWWVIVAIVAIVAAGLLVLWFILGRRRKSDQQAQK
ncbi:MAG: YDG domain-containing protein [Dehalococcoidia bacterium]|nr:YDG domain-containing protein [Dehalococcoidia bacterium]